MPKITRQISDKLYGDGYAVRKTTISAKFYLPIRQKQVEHRFCIAEISKHSDGQLAYEGYLKELRGNDISVSRSNLTPELKRYCPDCKDGSIYFFIEVFEGGKKLPAYYGILYMNDYSNIVDHDRNGEYKAFFDVAEKELMRFVWAEKLHPSFRHRFDGFVHDVGYCIEKYLDRKKKHCDICWDDNDIGLFEVKGEEKELTNETNVIIGRTLTKFERLAKGYKEPALQAFVRTIIDEFYARAKRDHNLRRCADKKCNAIFGFRREDHKNNKKRCHKKDDGKDCVKATANRKQYIKKTKKPI